MRLDRLSASRQLSRTRLRLLTPAITAGHVYSATASAFILALAISLRVTPLVSFAPATLTIQVRVHPEPSDRQVQVTVDGENFSRLSKWDIDPSNCPTLFSYPLKDLPAGQYEIVAQIGDWSSVRASDRQTVEIH